MKFKNLVTLTLRTLRIQGLHNHWLCPSLSPTSLSQMYIILFAFCFVGDRFSLLVMATVCSKCAYPVIPRTRNLRISVFLKPILNPWQRPAASLCKLISRDSLYEQGRKSNGQKMVSTYLATTVYSLLLYNQGPDKSF